MRFFDAAGMPRSQAALMVFVGGACYGANATCYKISYALGFSWSQVVVAQAFFGLLCFAIAFCFGPLRHAGWVKLGRSSVLKLLGLGLLTTITSVLYCYAMSVLPVPLALTLLFQFTWVGTVIQVIMTRRPSSAMQVLAAILVVLGTVLASGLYETSIEGFELTGIAAGLLAAVSCASFVTLSGRVVVPCSHSQRGMLVCLGSIVASSLFCPDFFMSGALFDGLAPTGFISGLFGFLVPILLFGVATPHLPAGLSTVMASAELPAGLLVAMLVLGTPINPIQWLGVAIILGGVCVAQVRLGQKGQTGWQ